MTNIISRVRAAYDLEITNAGQPRHLLDLPISYESITSEWLTTILCRLDPGARVIGHQLDAPNEGNTSRRRIFLHYNDLGNAAGLPATIFCKASHHFSSRVSVGVAGGLHAETTFYNRVRPLLDIEAPTSNWANYDPVTLNSIIMLNDLGDDTEFCSLATDMNMDRLRDQMDLLASLHAPLRQGGDKQHLLASFASWQDFFADTLRIGLADLCESGFRAGEGVIPSSIFARAAEIWPATLESVARHDQLSSTLIHSDVHLRNWYISPGGRMGLADWQATCRGHWSRDLAYTIVCAAPVDVRRSVEKELIEYYLRRLEAYGEVPVSFDEAWLNYRQQMFGALAWWTVTLAPSKDLPDMQPQNFTIEMIKRITQAIEDLDSLDSF